MTYKDFFEGHAVKTTIAEIKGLLSAIIEKYPDAKDLDEIMKIDSSLQYISNVINTAHYYISPRGRLDSINAHLANVKTYLSQYQANRSNQLVSAISSVEEAVIFAVQIVQNNSSQKNIVNISPKEIIEKLAQTSETTISTLQTKTSEFNQKSNEFVSKLKTAENNFNAVQQRVDSYLATLQASYNAEEKTRQDSFEKDKADIQKKVEILLNELDQKKQEAGKILQIVSNTGFAGNYSKNADAEKKSANRLRCISIGIFLIVSFLALHILFTFQRSGISWQGALVRILATSLPSALATYLARESGKHRKLERFYRNMELELSALDAFIENIPKEERNKLKIEITRKLFSGDRFIYEIDSKNEEESKAVLSIPESLARTALDFLNSVIKK